MFLSVKPLGILVYVVIFKHSKTIVILKLYVYLNILIYGIFNIYIDIYSII